MRKLFVLLAAMLLMVITSCSGGGGSDPIPPSPSTLKAITAFSLAGVVGTINETGKTIAVAMPFGTDVTALVATFTTTGASVKVGSTLQVSGTTANNFTSPVTYTVTAADASTQDYTVTVTVAASSAKAITAFSLAGVVGTINETGKTIAVTMPSGTSVTALVATFTTTGANVKVGSTVQVSGTTANNFTSPVIYTVTAADATTQDYTVTVAVAASPAKAITAFSLAGVDGTINETGKTIAVAMPFGTLVTNLVATFTTTGASVKVGSTVQISGTTAHNFTSPVIYTVTAADATTQDYTVTVAVAASSAKAITAFSLAGVVGTINETGKTIAVAMPFGTSVTALVATFTTTGANVKVGSTVQVSGTTAHNFTSPVIYTVTAADATTQDYTVTVAVAASSAKAITAFSLAGVVGTINETGKTIAVTMPSGTSVTALVATFTTTGANVKVGSTLQISGTTANNFTGPVTYTVTASDATTQDYTATASAPTYAISGNITLSGAALSSVTVSLTGASTTTTTTDANGNYAFAGAQNGSYTITPSRTGYTFSPTSKSITVNGANLTGQDFTATASTPTYTISGNITLSGAALSSVIVSLTGASTTTTTTEANGNYAFAGAQNGSYTVTPSLAGYTFSPANRSVAVNGTNLTGQDFTATNVSTGSAVTSAVASPTSLLAGGTARYEFSFKATSGLPTGSTITVEFPAGFNLAGVTKTQYSSYVALQSIVGQTITYSVSTLGAVSAGDTLLGLLTQTDGIVNPAMPGTYLLKIHTSNDPTPVVMSVMII